MQGATSNEPTPSRGFQNRIHEAQQFAEQWKDEYISSDHLLLAFWKNGNEPFSIWKDSTRLSLKQIEETIKQIRGQRHMDSPTAESAYKPLKNILKTSLP